MFYNIMLAAFLFPTYSNSVQAQDSSQMLVTISPQEYLHPVTLWQYYYNYAFYQGPTLEPVAINMLNEKFGHVGLCRENLAANTLLKIRPGMFYNPKMSTYYGKLNAQVYSGSGKILGSYVIEAEKSGFLYASPERQITDTYRLAMQKLIEKMQADEAMQRVMKEGIPANETKSPCSIVSVLPEEITK